MRRASYLIKTQKSVGAVFGVDGRRSLVENSVIFAAPIFMCTTSTYFVGGTTPALWSAEKSAIKNGGYSTVPGADESNTNLRENSTPEVK
ncbi:MAG: hypothetical protein AAGA22_01340 [Pseudomonadota bacterium]